MTFHTNTPVIDNDLTLNDLVIRYGLSKDQITRYCFSMGLPYYRIGRQYHVRYDELVQWEIATRMIAYGHKNFLYLPAWEDEISRTKAAMANARKSGRKGEYRKLKDHYKKIRQPVRWFRAIVAILFMVLMLFFVLYAFHNLFSFLT